MVSFFFFSFLLVLNDIMLILPYGDFPHDLSYINKDLFVLESVHRFLPLRYASFARKAGKGSAFGLWTTITT